VAHLYWSRSSVPAPMSELEFSLLGVGYATGYERALTCLAGRPVKVLIGRRRGHLYSAVVESAKSAWPNPDVPTEPSWRTDVLPRIVEHFQAFRDLSDQPSHLALARARDLYAESVSLHHAMLVPARRAIMDLVATFATALGDRDTATEHARAAVMQAVTSLGTPVFRAAERLIGNSSVDARDDNAVIELIAESAVDGDGYGLALPGWLEDARYAYRARCLMQRFGVSQKSLGARRAAAAAGREEATARLRHKCPAGWRNELEHRLTRARVGAALAEEHGPAMHVRYVHELRQLVITHGGNLAAQGALEQPGDIIHTRLEDLARSSFDRALIRSRSAAYGRRLSAPVPPPCERTRRPPAGYWPMAPEVASRLCIQAEVAGRAQGRIWRGVAAAPGDGEGSARIVRRQEDFDMVGPGDIALVPDAGPAWGWLALAGVPLVIEQGGALSHAPAVARECGTPCVVAGARLSNSVKEGDFVMVSGSTGRVSW
jgi:phosphohistidine swiveling domain-containing protein